MSELYPTTGDEMVINKEVRQVSSYGKWLRGILRDFELQALRKDDSIVYVQYSFCPIYREGDVINKIQIDHGKKIVAHVVFVLA